MFKIKEMLREVWGYHRYDVVLCSACDRVEVQVINTDPGSVEEAIGVADFCTECADKVYNNIAPYDSMMILEREPLWDLREEQGLLPWSVIEPIFSHWYFVDCKVEPDWDKYLVEFLIVSEGRSEEEVKPYLERLPGLTMEDFKCEDEFEYSDEDIATMAWVYGAGPKPTHDMTAQDEAYDDLMRDRARDLGVSCY